MAAEQQDEQRLVVIVTGAGSGIGRAIAESLARAGHQVYAGLRDVSGRNHGRAVSLTALAQDETLDIQPLELDVLSDAGCRSAVDQVLLERGRVDMIVNNAGMLMTGVAEAFTPQQFTQVLETNAVSWLRVNRAVLPAMRRQGSGILAYVSSTTAHVTEPFMATYVASKAAGESFAESLGLEVAPLGVETIILVPGAFTTGTEHFAHSNEPDDTAVAAQYGALPDRIASIPARLHEIDLENGGSAADVRDVGDALVAALEMPRGTRPRRVIVDAQNKGVDEINAVREAKQARFFQQLGIADLLEVSGSD